MKFPDKKATKLTTSFPGPLLFPFPGAKGKGRGEALGTRLQG